MIVARRKRRSESRRLVSPERPPKPERPTIRSDSPKLARAVDLFGEYQVAAGVWVTTRGVAAHSPAVGSLSLSFPPAPGKLSALIGDCLQNLRSALDHEVYRQSQALRGQLWPGLTQAQFPIHAEAKTFPRVMGSALGGVRPAVSALVRSLQPFGAAKDPAADVLELLHLAARIDRHRLLHVAAAQPKAHGLYRFRPELAAIEGKLVVRLELIDFAEPRLMNLDIHQFLHAAIVTVDTTIQRMVEAESRTDSTVPPGNGEE